MASQPEKQEYFMRVEAYFGKEQAGYWRLLIEALKKISKHVSTRLRTEVYEGFSMTLFHEEELEKTLHVSLHFTGLRSPLIADSIVNTILELCDYVEVYFTVKGSIEHLQGMGENFYVKGVGVRVSTYPDKGVATFSYRLFKPNRGMNLASKILSGKTVRSRTVSEMLRSLLGI
jgi:hypothetical protein